MGRRKENSDEAEHCEHRSLVENSTPFVVHLIQKTISWRQQVWQTSVARCLDRTADQPGRSKKHSSLEWRVLGEV